MRGDKMIYLKSLDEIPKFKNEKEEAEFWDSHSIARIWDQLESARVTLASGLKNKIQERHQAKRLISLRIEPEKIDTLKEIALRKGVGYLTLIRMWVNEKISKEQLKFRHMHT